MSRLSESYEEEIERLRSECKDLRELLKRALSTYDACSIHAAAFLASAVRNEATVNELRQAIQDHIDAGSIDGIPNLVDGSLVMVLEKTKDA